MTKIISNNNKAKKNIYTVIFSSIALILMVFINNTYAEDFSYYQNKLQTPHGMNLKSGYTDFYKQDLQQSFITNTYQTIEINFADKLRKITKQLYQQAVNKTFYEISLASKLQYNHQAMLVLRSCVDNKADYFTVEQKCVPHDLWAEGYKVFAQCAASHVKGTVEACLPT